MVGHQWSQPTQVVGRRPHLRTTPFPRCTPLPRRLPGWPRSRKCAGSCNADSGRRRRSRWSTRVSSRYRPELPLALKDVSCVIEPKAKVGIVGRTGSGKTTFVSALWRLVEPTKGAEAAEPRGALAIDGVDLSTLELHALRSRLATLPTLASRSLASLKRR